MKPRRQTSLAIVGTGPGDPELISLKGIRAIKEADVLICNGAISPELIEHAPVHCKTINIGQNGKYLTMSEINRLIRICIGKYEHVVLLEQDDPLSSGNCSDVIAFAQQEGIPVSSIPGISCALGVPAISSIPVTIRGVNESFFVLSQAPAPGLLWKEMLPVARSGATVVLSGEAITRAKEILEIFQQVRGGDEPVAVLHNSMHSEPLVIYKTLGVLQFADGFPANQKVLMVIGKVVRASLTEFICTHEGFQRSI